MTDLIFYGAQDSYEVVGTDCCLVSHERMRLSANGSLGIGGGRNILERYPFMTAEVAQICADVFNRDFRNNQILREITLSGLGLTIGQPNVFEMRDCGREVVRIDSNHRIVKLDLPYITWIWLRTTAPVRIAKALWRGWA